jgi:hypothetical protein
VGKVIGILAIALGVWLGAEVMMNGTHGAFDGLFVRLGIVQALEKSDGERIEAEKVPVRAAERLRSAYEVGIDRTERLVDEN